MNFSSCLSAIATTTTSSKTEVHTPQRKARYNDPSRIRLKDIKRAALRDIGCSSSAEMKKYLQASGIKLDLRLTAAWVAIVFELRDRIKAVKEEFELRSQPPFKSGDRVIWDYPMGWGYIEVHFPLVVTKVVGDIAYLDLLAIPVPVRELSIAA